MKISCLVRQEAHFNLNISILSFIRMSFNVLEIKQRAEQALKDNQNNPDGLLCI